jgi:hypothetical protein
LAFAKDAASLENRIGPSTVKRIVMDRRKKTNHEREKTRASYKTSKQLTLDNLPAEPEKKPREKEELLPSSFAETPDKQNKQIIITQIGSVIEEDELTLDVEFKLVPDKNAFSKLKSDLWFDEKRIKSVIFDILHSFGTTDEFTLKAALDLNGMEAGPHAVKVEMYEPSSSGQMCAYTLKEAMIEYFPQKRESRLKKVPTVKRIEGEGIAVVSDSEKDIYREIEDAMKKDLISKRDEW